jgi:microcystin degradation protein MlrC
MIGMYRTPFQPMRSFVDAMTAAEGKDGVLSLSLGHGFPWGDVPHVGTRMLAVTDNNPAQAQRVAEQFGMHFVGLRHETHAQHIPYPDAITQALQEAQAPVVIADVTDNPGGGAPSDSTFLLKELLDRDVRSAAVAMIWDPIVVQIAKGAGKGAILDVRLGGKLGPVSGSPLDLRVEVLGIIEDLEDQFPQTGSNPIPTPCGDSVALRCKGVDIIVNSQRTQVLTPRIFTEFGIDVSKKQIIVVKSTQHFYAAYSRIASRVIYADAPGALQSDVREIPYEHDHSRKYPWTDDPFAG